MSLWLALWAVTAAQDDVVEAKIGEVRPARSGTQIFVRAAPTLDRAVSSYAYEDALSMLLENGAYEQAPVKFVGWSMPDRKSVVLARKAGSKDDRRLLVGGVEETSSGLVYDVALLEEGKRRAVVVRTSQGMVFKDGPSSVGPAEKIDIVWRHGDRLALLVTDSGKRVLRYGEREFPVEGDPMKFAFSPDGSRPAWVERLADGRQQAVVDGKRGIPCGSVPEGIFFSPSGNYVAYVTREGDCFRGWVDGEEIRSDASVVAPRVFDDGRLAYVEMTLETPAGGAPDPLRGPVARGRLVVGGKREDRVLDRPVFLFQARGGGLHGASRGETSSVIVDVASDGKVTYEDVKGTVGELFCTPSGDRRLFTVTTPEGTFVQVDGKRKGPFEKVGNFFYLEFAKQFGHVAVKGGAMQLAVGEKIFPIALTELAPPVRISKTELTISLVGIFQNRTRKEVWVRVVALD